MRRKDLLPDTANRRAMRIEEHIERGHTIVCAGVRLAHHLRHRYAREQLRRNRRAWETPDILPWQAWLRRCLDAGQSRNHTGLLLNDEQENTLWKQIIDASGYQASLLKTAPVAVQAAAAWQCLKQYQIPAIPEDAFPNKDVFAFKSWADEYRSHCRQNHWHDNASLPELLRRDVAMRPDLFGNGVLLAGFDRLSPQQATLCRELAAAGIAVHEYQPEARNLSAKVACFADVNQEINAAALWAKQLLEEDPDTTIGILTPQPGQMRNRLRYVFEDVLTPGNLHYGTAAAAPPFTVSAGQPLTDYPLIRLIFPIIGMNRASLTLETLGVLLRTPFIKGHDRERAGRALLDEKLRSGKRPELPLNRVIELAEAGADRGQPVPLMAAMLRAAAPALDALPARQSPENWGADFVRLLEVFGWPGERAPDSAEYQQMEAWHSVLDRFVSLQVVCPVMSRLEALFHIRRIAGGLGFQPKTAETPIQILDPRGSAAMSFEHIWMPGLTEESWPPRIKPNPFLPLALQKKHGVPGADADHDRQRAEHLQALLVRSTPDITLSHARYSEDRPLLPSPLLRDLPAAADAGTRDSGIAAYPRAIFDSRKTETFTDTMAPPVRGRYRGGASIFQDQSQCPFRAFARHRLGSREPDSADIGMDAMERGSLLHRLMEKTWSRLESRDKLAALSEEQQAQLIESLVRELLEESRRKAPLLFTARFCALESARLTQVLRDWLRLESQRRPFTVIGVEEKREAVIAGLEFRGRLDRIDELPDGSHIIIDYKSGTARAVSWAGERPDEPQLPLYAVTHPESVAAVAFAVLKRGESGFAGLAESEDLLPGAGAFAKNRQAKKFIPEQQEMPQGEAPDWKRLLDNWRATLENLAQEFCRGVATVTPKSGAMTCRYCDQQPLCRIHELSRVRADTAPTGAQDD